jgi:hypothetical protein
LGIPDETLREVELAFDSVEGRKGLKPVFDALDGKHHYGVLRCVAAALGKSV